MLVADLLKSSAELTTGLNAFGYGPKDYSDLSGKQNSLTVFEKANEEQYPRIWLYPVGVEDEIAISSAVLPTYRIEMIISKRIKYSVDPQTIADEQDSLLAISREHISRFKKNKEVKKISRIVRKPVVHLTNQNLVGYFISFQVELNETITNPC